MTTDTTPSYAAPRVPPERQPTTLSGFLAEATAGVTFNREIVEEAARGAVSAFDLFSAGPTEHSAQMVARCEAAISEHKEKGDKIPKALQIEHRHWLKRLGIALKRDELDAARKAVDPSCFCFGLGGRLPVRALAIETPDGRILTDPTVEVFDTICPCPLGQATRIDLAVKKRALMRADQLRRTDKLWDALKLPHGLGETITFESHVDQRAMRQARRWYQGGFTRDGQVVAGLLMTGLGQRGKTTTGYLLAKQAIEDGRGVVGITAPDLFEQLTDTFRHDERLKADPEQPPQTTHAQLIASLQAVPFLFLDDLGAEKMSDYVERALYQVFNVRADASIDEDGAQVLWTVITTNLSQAELLPRLGSRLYSRVAKLCAQLTFSQQQPMLGPAAGGLLDLNDFGEPL